MARKLKVDPVTNARNAVRVFEEMQKALDFLNDSVKDMIAYNLEHAKKVLAKMESEEEKKLNEIGAQSKMEM